jgi:hypothetical protein
MALNLRKFNEYELKFSKDPEKFKKRIGLTCESLDIFDSQFNSVPLVRWGKSDVFEENSASNTSKIYNRTPLPTLNQLYSDLSSESFVPKSVMDRSLVKKMNFPIVAMNETETEEFKTYGKYKKSKKNWLTFTEKLKPQVRMKALAFRDKLIHLEEKVGGFIFDVRPTYDASDISKILESIYNVSCPDFYEIDVELTESGWKLCGIGHSDELNPLKQLKIYECAYRDAYSFSLPNWFKSQIRKEHLKPYYSGKILEERVVKPKYSIDYKKEADKC